MFAGVEGFEGCRFAGCSGREDGGLAAGSGAQVGPGSGGCVDLGQGEGDEGRSFVLDAGASVGHGCHVPGHRGIQGDADR